MSAAITDDIIRISPPGSFLGEGPLWSARDNAIYWVDILGHKLHRYRLDDQSLKHWVFPEPIGWVIERKGGGFIAGLKSGFTQLTLEPFTLKHIGDPEPQHPDNRLNDAKADRWGRIWAGSLHMPQTEKSGGLHRLEADLSFKHIDGPYQVANGPTFSPDHTKIYHTDSGLGEVYVFDLDADGNESNKRLFVAFNEDTDGSPDGMTTDAQGGIWIAHWGGARISRFRPDGTLDFAVPLPAKQITSMTFAGPNLDRLFVTSAAIGQPDDKEAGTLFEVPSPLLRGHTGLPTLQFGG